MRDDAKETEEADETSSLPKMRARGPLTKSQLKIQKLKTTKARTTVDEGIESLTPRKDSVFPENILNAAH